jgi:TonB family protein
MRKVIVAALALSPLLLHAQANSPAQPQSTSLPTLQSKLVRPAEFDKSTTTASAAHLAVSTGVVPPKLIYTIAIASDAEINWKTTGIDRTVVVGMTVDEHGKPTDLKIVRSAGETMDKNVLAAVSQYRFKPGTLDHKPATVPVNLEIVMHNPVR